jgi:hypothetical protein
MCNVEMTIKNMLAIEVNGFIFLLLTSILT